MNNKSKTALVTTSGNKVLKALLVIETKLKGLEAIKHSTPKTNGKFKYAPYSNVELTISNITSIIELINIDSYLKSKDAAYNESAETTFGLKEYPSFRWQGFTYEEWVHDLKQQMAAINYSTSKAELEKQKAKIDSCLSKQDRINLMLLEMNLLEDETEEEVEDEE